MNLMWDHLLPAIHDDATLPADGPAERALTQALAALALAPAAGEASSPRAAGISGRTFTLDENPLGVRTVRFDVNGDGCTFTVDGGNGLRSVACGWGRWVTADNRRTGPDDLFPVQGRTDIATKIAASAAWPEPDTLAMTWQYVENIHHDDITCTFDGRRVTITFAGSVQTMQRQPDPRPVLVGRLTEA